MVSVVNVSVYFIQMSLSDSAIVFPSVLSDHDLATGPYQFNAELPVVLLADVTPIDSDQTGSTVGDPVLVSVMS